MKNIILVAAIMLIFVCPVFGQVSYPTNNPALNPIPLGYLGWDDILNTLLDVKQDDLLRMRFRGVPYAPVGGVPSGPGGMTNYTSASRVMLDVQGDNTWNAITPYSMLHLHGSLAAPNMRREWMHVGTSYTDEGDAFYVGLQQQPDNLYNPGGNRIVDATLAWGCNYSNESSGPDNMRFIFIQPMNSSGNPENSQSGLEVARFTPEGDFGIGNFYTNGLDEQPTQKLDVDGTARLRQMPSDDFDVVITGVYAEDPGVDGDYILHYSTIENFTDGISDEICEWDEVTNGPNDDLVMGYTGACNQGRVGIGVSNPGGSKLRVLQETAGGVNNFTTRSQGIGSAARVWGLYGRALTNGDGNSQIFYPVAGVHGNGYSTDCFHDVIGVYGTVSASASCNGVWAGYFEGDVEVTGGITATSYTTFPSDAGIKQNIEDLEGSIALISQLNPKSYQYVDDAELSINLPEGTSYGLIAQEVEEVLPELVKDVRFMAKFDSLGNVIAPPLELKGVQYTGLIPLIISGVKEQQYQIDQQAQTIENLQQSLNNQNDLIAQMMDQMDALADQVNDCCESGLKFNPLDDHQGNLNEKATPNGNILEQNVPNPFRSQTNISYTLEHGGKVLLNIFDKTGKPITTLVEAEQSAGNYRYEWDASGLPAGLYHYALYVDGELLVKKAIKLAD